MDDSQLWRTWLLVLGTFVGGFVCGFFFAVVKGYLSIDWQNTF